MTTYTVRAEGMTAWAEGLTSQHAARMAYHEAYDRGLRLLHVTEDDADRDVTAEILDGEGDDDEYDAGGN